MVQQRRMCTGALCLVAMASSGLLTAQPPHQSDQPHVERHSSTPQTPQIAFFLPMEITNRVFTEALLRPASHEYQTLYKEVSDLLKSIYDCPDYDTCPTDVFYGGVTAMTFSSGSVIATPTVVFNTFFINPSIIHFFFFTKANNVQPQTLQFNLDFTTKDKITLATANTTTTITTTTSATPTSPTSSPATNRTATTPATITAKTTPATNTLPQTLRTPSTMTPPNTKSATTTSPTCAAVSSTWTIPGNKRGVYPTNGIKKIAMTSTSVNLHKKHTYSSRNTKDPPTASDNSNDLIPAWWTAVLILAAAILLMLVIIFIMMVVQWCTKHGHTDPIEDTCYFEKKQPPHDPLPAYTPEDPATQGPGSTTVTAGNMPRKNRIGFYVVNP